MFDAGSVTASLQNLYEARRHKPSSLHTDCFFWPHLDLASTWLEQLVGILPERPAGALAAAALGALARRLDETARQVLVFEAALFRESGERRDISSVPDLVAAATKDVTLVRDILQPYPELIRLLSAQTADLCTFILRSAHIIATEWDRVSAKLGDFPSLSDLSVAELASSDPHAHGCAVIALGASGEEPLVALKPRSTAAEEALTRVWQGYALSRFPDWALPLYHSHEDHGWVKWYPQRPCISATDVEAYYTRAGYILGLSVGFGVTDLNRDNIVACGPSPIPVDLEACLHHRKKPTAPSRAGRILPRVMEWNVLGTGLLPMWIWKGEDLNGVDLSGLGSLDEQWCSIPLQQFVDRDSAAEQVVRAGVRLLPARNIVKCDGQTQYPWEHIERILEGYRAAITDLQQNMVRFKKAVELVSKCQRRFLARPTAGYYYAIQASLHPFYLVATAKREAFIRDALLDGSAIASLAIDSEVQACMDCDIPRFVTRDGLTTEEPHHASGQVIALSEEEFLDGTSAAISDHEFLSQPHSLLFAERLIRGSLMALQTTHESPQAIDAPPRSIGPITESMVDAAVKSSGEFLLRFLESSTGPEGDYYGFRAAPAGQYEFGLIGGDLYSGSAGILLALYWATRQSLLTETSTHQWIRRICEYVARSVTEYREPLGGAYCGVLSSVLPTYVALVGIGDSSSAALFARAVEARVLSHALADDDREFWGSDFLAGRSGALAILASLHRVTALPGLLHAIDMIVERLGRDAQPEGPGIVWRQPAVSAAHHGALTGLSHGQAGFALGLAEAASTPCTLREQAAELAVGAIQWELDSFDARYHNWPDFRRRSNRPLEGEFAWSHGAPGTYMALERIHARLSLPDVERFLREYPYLSVLKDALGSRPSPINHSICHGALGTFLLSRRLLRGSDQDVMNDVQSWCNLGHWAEFDARPFRQMALDAPGFFVGRAGSLAGWLSIARRADFIPFCPADFEPLARPRC